MAATTGRTSPGMPRCTSSPTGTPRRSVRRRYDEQLAPPQVRGARALVDSASLLWRAVLDDIWDGPVPIQPVLAAVEPDLLTRPSTGLGAPHAAVALTTAGDVTGLERLQAYAATAPAAVLREVAAPLIGGLRDFAAEYYDSGANQLIAVTPRLIRLGGSAAQREVRRRFAPATTPHEPPVRPGTNTATQCAAQTPYPNR